MIQLGVDIDPSKYLESAVNYYYLTYDISGSVEKLKSGIYMRATTAFLYAIPRCIRRGSLRRAVTRLPSIRWRPTALRNIHGPTKRTKWRKAPDLAQIKIPGLKDI